MEKFVILLGPNDQLVTKVLGNLPWETNQAMCRHTFAEAEIFLKRMGFTPAHSKLSEPGGKFYELSCSLDFGQHGEGRIYYR